MSSYAREAFKRSFCSAVVVTSLPRAYACSGRPSESLRDVELPNQPAPLAPAFLPSACNVENAKVNAQGKRRPGLQNRDPQPLFPADLLVQRLIAQKDIKIDDLPANPVVDCSLKAMLTPLEACLQGAGEVCCAAIDAAFAPSTNASTRNCLCLSPVETTGLAVGLGFGINFDEVRN
jgi:hypothetical protein